MSKKSVLKRIKHLSPYRVTFFIRIFIITVFSISALPNTWAQSRAACNPPIFSFHQIDSCNRITFENIPYYSTTSVVRVYSSTKGCDSTVTYHLKVRQGDSLILQADSCDRVHWRGINFYRDTTVFRRWPSSQSCDTLVRMQIRIRKQSQTLRRLDSCNRYSFSGQVFVRDTLIRESYLSSNGCDSTVLTSIHIRKSTSSILYFDTCDRMRWKDSIYRQSTELSYLLRNSEGCDSLQTVRIQIRSSSQNSQTLRACQELSYRGQQWIRDTVLYETFVNASRCDSNLITYIRIGQPMFRSLVIDSCEQVLFEGRTWGNDTSFKRHLVSVLGCDSTVDISIRIRQKSESRDTLSSCDFVSYKSRRYNYDTLISEHYLNAARCDSTIWIHIHPIPIARDTLRRSFCENDSVYFGSQYLKYPGTYQRSIPQDNGCLHYETLILKLNPTHRTLYFDSIVQSRMPYQRWGFRVPFAGVGDTIIIRSYTNRLGCDSSFVLRLHVISDTQRLIYPILFSKYQKLLICRVPDSLKADLEQILWYKNDQYLAEQNGLYIYEADGLDGRYRALLRQVNGMLLTSESLVFVKDKPLRLSRNPVQTDQYVTLHRPFTPEEWQNIYVEVHHSNGQKRLSYKPQLAPIELPPMDEPGLYIITIYMGTGQQISTKLIVL